MKSTLKLIGAAALLLAVNLHPNVAQAQPVPSYGYQVLSLPATIPAATTTNLASPAFIDAKKTGNVALQFETTWSVTGVSAVTNLIFTLAPTVDGVSYDTNQTRVISQGEYGPTKQVMVTNLPATGLAGWYIIAIQNVHATGVATNRVLQGIKIGAP